MCSYTLKPIHYIVIPICIFLLLAFLTSCCNFSNVMTSGTASDIVDSIPTTDIKADATIPLSPL